jgi:hypothetical protein
MITLNILLALSLSFNITLALPSRFKYIMSLSKSPSISKIKEEKP